MFSVWCWCMCMGTFVFAEKQALTQDEILNPTLEPLTQLITPEQKLQDEENSIANQHFLNRARDASSRAASVLAMPGETTK